MNRRFHALDFEFSVRSTDAALGRYLDRVLRPLATDGHAAAPTYSVVTCPRSGNCRLEFDEEILIEAAAPSLTVSHILWDVNRRAVAASSSRYLLVHASAAEHSGSALLFPASTESGKTTLVAALVEAGLGYLTDEVVAIEPETLTVIPYPKALSLDPGSWVVLQNLDPHLNALEATYAGNQWQVDPHAIRMGSVAGPCPPRFVVLPSYQVGSTTSLTSLETPEAVVALAQNSFNLPEHGQVALESYAAIAQQSRCFRLTVGDLGEACRLVLALLSRSQRRDT